MTVPEDEPTTDDIAARVFASAIATFETMSIYTGERLGWYRSLADHGPATSDELAERTSTHVRYTREWLELQAVYGLLHVVDPDPDHSVRRYAISPAVAEVLLDGNSLAYLGALPRMVMASAMQLPGLLDAYRSGGGVSWDRFGDDARESQALLNRPWLERELAGALGSVPALHQILSAQGARVADLGSGGGWSSIGLARAYPAAEFHGFDVDPPSVAMARRHASAAGLDERVTFHLSSGTELGGLAPFDLILACECVHDMAQPVEVLRAARAALAPGGVVVVMDEAVADEFAPSGDDVERFMYGCSLFVCLPDGMSSSPSEMTGTVMRRSVLTGYAQRAGFTSVEVLPIENFNVWRFYLLAG